MKLLIGAVIWMMMASGANAASESWVHKACNDSRLYNTCGGYADAIDSMALKAGKICNPNWRTENPNDNGFTRAILEYANDKQAGYGDPDLEILRYLKKHYPCH